jgi:uncharacterized Tic20 family protein
MDSINSIYLQVPQPHELSVREKEDAMGAYLMMFAGVAVALPLPLLNLIASYVYLYLNKSKGRYVHFHSLQALYSQIPVTILNLGLLVWLIVNLVKDFTFTSEFKGYAIMVAVVNIVDIVFSLIAAAKARKGLMYYYIFFGRISYQQAFSSRQKPEKDLVNRPPKL